MKERTRVAGPDGKWLVDVEFDFKSYDDELAAFINENAEAIAKQIATDAKASVNVKTGNLRKGISARKSKFDDGGWIVISRAPHSHLVEFGHGGPKPAPPHPFLRPALNKNIGLARQKFGAK
jgi:HK97 gp10 family phage protein